MSVKPYYDDFNSATLHLHVPFGPNVSIYNTA